MKLVGVLILLIIAVFIIVMLMTFFFHLLFILPIVTTPRLDGEGISLSPIVP